MHPEMSKLIQIKELEVELIALKGKAEAISIPLEKSRARRFAARKDMIDAQDKLTRIIEGRRGIERDLAELSDKLQAAEARMSAVRNAKEAQAQESEMERLKSDISAAEDEALDLLEKEEMLSARIEQATIRTDRDVAVIDEEMNRLAKLLQENQHLARGVREDRIAAVNRLDKPVRENYDWLLKRYGPGQAIVSVNGGACGGCGSILLPDQALKMDDSSLLHRCTHCNRYLLGWKAAAGLG